MNATVVLKMLAAMIEAVDVDDEEAAEQAVKVAEALIKAAKQPA